MAASKLLVMFEELENKVAEVKEDVEKFDSKGVAVAGRRARVGLQEVKKMAQEIRIIIQEMKNNG